jgi:hypothetical protein
MASFTIPGDENRGSLWNVGHNLLIDSAARPGRSHCMLCPWKLETMYKDDMLNGEALPLKLGLICLNVYVLWLK